MASEERREVYPSVDRVHGSAFRVKSSPALAGDPNRALWASLLLVRGTSSSSRSCFDEAIQSLTLREEISHGFSNADEYFATL